VFVKGSCIADNPEPFQLQKPQMDFRRHLPPGPPAVGSAQALVRHEICQRKMLLILTNEARNGIRDNNGFSGKANGILKRSERIAQMKQDCGERDDVESADFIGHIVSCPMD
jgi:hypothetical protein